MRSKDGQHYPTQRVPGYNETAIGHATADDSLATDEVLTQDGAVAIDGGKLPGNHDDFAGEVDANPRPVPGAFGEVHSPERGAMVDGKDGT